MKEAQGVWLPDDEEHLQRYFEGYPATYQYKKYKAALRCIKTRKNAIDVGGHAGLWSMNMVNDFEYVSAFEPISEHRECFKKNVKGDNHTLYPYACGEVNDTVSMCRRDKHTGYSYVSNGKDKDPIVEEGVEQIRIDDFDFEDVSFIKLDCEGYEYQALKGAENTIKRCKPVIIVEQKPGNREKYGKAYDGRDYLIGLGMKLHVEMSSDFIMKW